MQVWFSQIYLSFVWLVPTNYHYNSEWQHNLKDLFIFNVGQPLKSEKNTKTLYSLVFNQISLPPKLRSFIDG